MEIGLVWAEIGLVWDEIPANGKTLDSTRAEIRG